MDFTLSEEQQLFKETMKKFVDTEIKPNAAKIDEAGVFPAKEFQKVGQLGYFGLRYPEEVGGTNASKVTYILGTEELARGNLSLAALCSMQSLMGTYFLYRSGNKEIHEKYLVPALRGEKVGAICMTEHNVGSDLSAISTKSIKDGDSYIINGEKMWVTFAPVADFFTVFAQAKDKEGKMGLTPFLVPKETEGLTVGKKIEKMGVRAAPTSELSLNNCRIPEINMLGKAGKGMDYLKEILVEIRVLTAALAVGVGQAALEDAVQYSQEREQFGRKIKSFQAIKMKIADMVAAIDVARCYTYYAAWRSDQKLENMKEATIAKLFASEAANKVADDATRIMASYGFAMEYSTQRYFRDARFTLIGGGTNEILRMIIAKEVGC